MIRRVSLAAALVVSALTTAVGAEPLSVKAVMSPKEQIYVDLPTTPKHFVLFGRREGRATGTGLLDGAAFTEYGMHDIRPGLDGSPRGYMVATLPTGDQAVIQWEVQATFVPGPDGKPRLLDNGVWRFVGGSGSLKDLKGAGILHIRAVSASEREFQLEGETIPAKP